jgi:alkanesulfonate monooxygenase SsuD/methylene tetrahydromethanopterin reductase-like flavin-dependent oxidoreductase (luciferase family)
VKHGLFLPPFDALSDVALLADIAVDAEAAGWDGVFLWDHILRPEPRPAADPWVALGVMAHVTERILLGPMVTPIARRRPQKLARETVTVDRLSAGRLILGLGLGVDTGRELSGFGEVVDERERAAMLDEGIELLGRMWSGETVHHHGAHYTADNVTLLPPALRGRIPIWLAARTTNRAPLRRAARHDGVFAVDVSLEQLTEMIGAIGELRGGLEGFEVAMVAYADRDMARHEAAGVTWWMSDIQPDMALTDVLAITRNGPPSA